MEAEQALGAQVGRCSRPVDGRSSRHLGLGCPSWSSPRFTAPSRFGLLVTVDPHGAVGLPVPGKVEEEGIERWIVEAVPRNPGVDQVHEFLGYRRRELNPGIAVRAVNINTLPITR